MTLEAAITELNANIVKQNALLATLIDRTPVALADRGAPSTPNKPAAPSSAAAASPPAPSPAAIPAAPPAPTPAAKPPEYADVQRAALNLGAKKGREALVQLLNQFGAPNARELQFVRYPEFIAEADALAASV